MTVRRVLAASIALVALAASTGGLVLWERPGEFVVVGGCRTLDAPDQPATLPSAIVADLGEAALGVGRGDLREPSSAAVARLALAAPDGADHYVCALAGTDQLVLLSRRATDRDGCYGSTCPDRPTELRTCATLVDPASGDWPLEHCPDLTSS